MIDLSPAQQAHVQQCYPDIRMQMAEYLRSGADVSIGRQDECGADVPPIAIWVDDNPAFWIDCCETVAAARERAQALGLHVTKEKPAPNFVEDSPFHPL